MIIGMNERTWLVKQYCRLVNENIYFIQEYFEGIVPAGRPDDAIYWKTKAVCDQLKGLMEKQADWDVNRILEDYLRFAVEYFEQGNPWNTREQDRKACRNTILNSLQMIANLTFWLDALGEEAAHSVTSWLELDATWKVQSVHSGVELSGAEELVLPVISCGA